MLERLFQGLLNLFFGFVNFYQLLLCLCHLELNYPITGHIKTQFKFKLKKKQVSSRQDKRIKVLLFKSYMPTTKLSFQLSIIC